MTNTSTLYNEKAAAKYLGGSSTPLSTRTMQRWRLEGGGPIFIKLGRLVRYRQSDLDEFIQSNQYHSTSMTLVRGGKNGLV